MLRTLIICILLMGATIISAQSLKVMTFNIRYDNPGDGPDRWDIRKQSVANFVEASAPDILGIQEGLHHQVQFLDSVLTQYSYIGVGRVDGRQVGEYSAVFYKRSSVMVEEEGTFWLSETGDTASVGWDASLERICTYGVFKMKDLEKRLLVFNAHFDHLGEKSRLGSAKKVVMKSEELNLSVMPVIVMGDFNAAPDSEPLEWFGRTFIDSRGLALEVDGPEGTWNGFDIDIQPVTRLDYIMVQKLTVLTHGHVVHWTEAGRHISDHLPVFATLAFQ